MLQVLSLWLMKLVVGLGNPGSFYSGNRHNIGFMCLRHLARQHGISLNKTQAKSRTGSGKIDGNSILLARPQTYMNLSGQSVRLFMNKSGLKADDLIVIHDDLDLPSGKVRIRRGGGSGGHKGLNSIIHETGGCNFIRIRFGIGRPEGEFSSADEKNEAISDYVLTDFSSQEKKAIKPSISLVSAAISCLLDEGLEAAMAKFN